MFFVRVGHWWFYKIPPPVMLLTLLLSGSGSPGDLLFALSCLVIVIALVCNVGYALNELFDVEEDARKGKVNVTTRVGARRLWLVIAAAVTGSLLVSYVGIGVAAFILTLCALLLPLAYSVPPLRLKQRKWLGVFADAVAAHVYPAVLCLLIAGQRTALAAGTPLVVAVLLWSLMFGLRGILSHQLVDDDLDRASNLTTVVHDHGRDNMIRLLLGFIVPIEIACFVFAILQISPGAVFYSVVCVYLVFEALKVKAGWQSIIFTRGKLSAYLPFLNNSFYEVWGPLAAALVAAANDLSLMVLPPLFVALFWRRFRVEWTMIDVLSRGVVRYVGSRLIR
jgi:1,4-dihydroxy-2-naphthoate octaprenyltransferase